jgi:hypothetical protein
MIGYSFLSFDDKEEKDVKVLAYHVSTEVCPKGLL